MIDRSQLPTTPVEAPAPNGHTLSHGEGEVSIVDELRALRQELKDLRVILVELRDMATHIPFLSKFRKTKG